MREREAIRIAVLYQTPRTESFSSRLDAILSYILRTLGESAEMIRFVRGTEHEDIDLETLLAVDCWIWCYTPNYGEAFPREDQIDSTTRDLTELANILDQIAPAISSSIKHEKNQTEPTLRPLFTPLLLQGELERLVEDLTGISVASTVNGSNPSSPTVMTSLWQQMVQNLQNNGHCATPQRLIEQTVLDLRSSLETVPDHSVTAAMLNTLSKSIATLIEQRNQDGLSHEWPPRRPRSLDAPDLSLYLATSRSPDKGLSSDIK